MRLRHLLLGCVSLALSLVMCPRFAQAYSPETLIGVVHAAGVYYFGSVDYMDQGAAEVAATGTHLIKVYLTTSAFYNTWTAANTAKYPWNSSWPAAGSNVLSMSLAPYFKSLFNNPFFTTYVMTTYCPNIGSGGDDYWYNNDVSPVPAADLSAETTQIQNLCANLLANYSGKTFIIENWEGDSALADLGPINANSTNNMAQWITARYKGVHNAMAAKGASTSNCYCAFEVNHVKDAIEEAQGTYGTLTCTNDVLPNCSTDYGSYSAYDSMMITSGTYSFANCVNWIAIHCPSTVKNGKTAASVGIGEFGCSENYQSATYNTNLCVNNVLPVVFDSPTPYCMYWNIYDNDLKVGITTAPQNGNNSGVQGYWLIKPDGTPATPWHLWRWQCIANDGTRYSTTKIKAKLTNTYTSAFTTGGLGTGWTTSAGSGFTIAPGTNQVVMSLTNGSGYPSCYCNLNVPAVTSSGTGLEPANGTQLGDYAEYTIDRSATGFMGVRLFGSGTGAGCDDGSGVQPWATYTGASGNGWTPISWYWNVEPTYGQPSPTFNFNTTNTLGMSLDSADGTFASVSYYLAGSYMGSYLYQTTDTAVNTLSLFAQDSNSGTETFTFGNVAIYQK